MAKVTTNITDKQSGSTQTHGGETVSRPVLNRPVAQIARNVSGASLSQLKSKYVLFNTEGQVVATLIDEALAEKWVADHKKGAIKFVKVGAA